MYRKYDIKKLNENELKLLTAFMMDNPEKDIKVYYSTYDTLGTGFKLIATTDKPKLIRMYGKCDFGNCIDITDYEKRLNEF